MRLFVAFLRLCFDYSVNVTQVEPSHAPNEGRFSLDVDVYFLLNDWYPLLPNKMRLECRGDSTAWEYRKYLKWRRAPRWLENRINRELAKHPRLTHVIEDHTVVPIRKAQ